MPKQSVAVVTDSTAFLPRALLDQYHVLVAPQNILWGDESYRDGIDITPEEFYRRLERESALPTTSQPSPGAFFECFTEAEEWAESIVAVVQSTGLSGTYASAIAAAEMMTETPVEVVDSLSTSLGCGLMVLAAARKAAAGGSLQEVAEVARTLVPHMRVIFVLDTLEYLHKGGRIGGAQRLLGSLLSVKPLLHLEEGTVQPLASPRTRRKAMQYMLNVVQEETAGATALHVGIVHANAKEEAEQLAHQVEELLQPVELIQSELSPVVGTHAGPGALGLIYYDGSVLGEES